ncbi:protein rep (plasmid) [Bifidobacterium breve]|nr:protein rep [Bifidobacterium breve]UUY18122.1 protein rep [Bifidobacterium breve]
MSVPTQGTKWNPMGVPSPSQHQTAERLHAAVAAKPQGVAAEAASGARSGPPWEKTNKITPSLSRTDLRRLAYGRRAESRKILVRHAGGETLGFEPIKLPRCARCGQPVDTGVGVMTNGEKARFTGTMLCGSIWACPTCSAIIRHERAHEVALAIGNHAEKLRKAAADQWQAEHEGQRLPPELMVSDSFGNYIFGTLTLRHDRTMPLAMTLDAILKGWTKMINGSPWQRASERWKIRGFVRAIEITYGVNGWHPHIHFVMFLDGDLDDGQREAMQQWLLDRWKTMVKRVAKAYKKKDGNPYNVAPNDEHGIDLQFKSGKDAGTAAAEYITKIQGDKGGVTLAQEIARGDIKNGRMGSVNPFQLLDSGCLGLSDFQREDLWLEYWQATLRRRCITWSRGLKEDMEVEELEDEELAEKADELPGLVGYVVPNRVYKDIRKSAPETLADALDAAEREDWQEVARLLPGGVILTDEQQDAIADGEAKPGDYLPTMSVMV